MKDILDEYGNVIIATVAAFVVLGFIAVLFGTGGVDMIVNYLNNSI